MPVNLSATFVAAYAVLCVLVSGLAFVRVWKAEGLPYKPIWVLGSLLGFFGFAVDPSEPGDLLLNIGVQIPVVYGVWSSLSGLTLKAMFPVVALVALVKLEGRNPDV